MEITTFFLLLVIGCCVGFLAGFFGVGGGVILVPVLVLMFTIQSVNPEVLTHMAMGTSLFTVVFASLSSAVKHSRQGNVFKKGVLVLGLSSVIFAFAGTYLASIIPGWWLRKIFSFAILFVSLMLLFENSKKEFTGEFQPKIFRLVWIGSVVGLFSSMTGVGGGVFFVPLLYFFVSFPIKLAIGTSSTTILLTATTAVAGYIINGWGNSHLPSNTIGFVDFLQAFPLIIGTVIFGPVGATIAQKTKSERLKKIFAVFLLINAILMFIK